MRTPHEFVAETAMEDTCFAEVDITASATSARMGVVHITTMPVELATAFLSAYHRTSSAHGGKDWIAHGKHRWSLRTDARNRTLCNKGSRATSLPPNSAGARANGATGGSFFKSIMSYVGARATTAATPEE